MDRKRRRTMPMLRRYSRRFGSGQGPGDTEAGETGIVIVLAVGAAPAARSRAYEYRNIGPGAAANDVLDAALGCPRAAVIRRAEVALMPAIIGPLPGISQHTVKPKRIGREAVHVGKQTIIILAAAAIAVRIADADGVAPPSRRGGPGPRCIFPFRFAGQAIWTRTPRQCETFPLNLGVQPRHIGLRVFPVQADRRPKRWFANIGRIGKTAARRAPSQLLNRIAGRRLIACLLKKNQKLL